MSIAEYKKIIKSMMSENRYNHCVNVSKEAVKLAKRYGGDEEKAAVAGILHDITKEMPKEEQLQIMLDSGIILDDIQKNAPKLWHGISGSVYIKKHFGIEDEDILNAICYHTTGRAGMSLIEKIIYVADCVSADRTYQNVSKLRKLSEKSLDSVIFEMTRITISGLAESGFPLHRDTVDAYNQLCLKKSEALYGKK